MLSFKDWLHESVGPTKWWYNHDTNSLYKLPENLHHIQWAYKYADKLKLSPLQRLEIAKESKRGTRISDVTPSSVENNSRVVLSGTGTDRNPSVLFITQGQYSLQRFKAAQDIVMKVGVPMDTKVVLVNWTVPDERYPSNVRESSVEATAKEFLMAKNIQELRSHDRGEAKRMPFVAVA